MDMLTQPNTAQAIEALKPAQIRAERETIALRALTKKRDFAPGVYGWEREQQALLIVRVVLDALETTFPPSVKG